MITGVAGMEQMPNVLELVDGSKLWEHTFEQFIAKVYLPKSDAITEIVNFGFRAPYLLVFEETNQSLKELVAFTTGSGLDKIAAEYGTGIVFIYPTAEGGWKNAPEDLFASIISESRIGQYYKDGTVRMRDRFTGSWGKVYLRGAVLRTYLYGVGESADFIAKNCLKRIEGDGLYGRGDISPAACVLQKLSFIPKPQVRDIPVVSVRNSREINEALRAGCDYFLEVERLDYQETFHCFLNTFRRMMGHLEQEADLDAMGMKMEPAFAVVKTSADNNGDDRETREHKIGYVAYYNKDLWKDNKQEEKVPLLLCFHGGGDSAMCMVSVSGWFRIAAKYGFLLVAVENHLNSTATETMELIDQLKKKYPIDSSRIYSTGFSMGGCKSWDMFQEYPKVFAAVAPMDATFEVGLNSYGQEAVRVNQETIVPVFYAGGEITPLPELPFQAQKCVDRMAYVLRVNQAKAEYNVSFDAQDAWENKIWGISGEYEYQLVNRERNNSILNLQLFPSTNGCCYCVFASVGGQGHEVRHHTCENAWRFLSRFRRLPDGSVEGGTLEEIKALYD